MKHDDQEYLLHEKWKKLPPQQRYDMNECYIWFYKLSQQPEYSFLEWQEVEAWINQWKQTNGESALN